MADSSIVQGTSFAYVVVTLNSFGTVLPTTNASVGLSDPSLGTNVVNPDGTGGLFTSTNGAGTETMTPSASGISPGTPFALDITVDQTPASVIISPASAAPASVVIQPKP